MLADDRLWYSAGEVDQLRKRVDDLLTDNDRMSWELWASQVAVRVLAERISELEDA
jgi:hypothetical protein